MQTFVPDFINGFIPRYSFLDLLHFSPENFRNIEVPACLELMQDSEQAFFEVKNRIDCARKEFLDDIITSLALDSAMDKINLGMVARLCVSFRNPYESELEIDMAVLEGGTVIQDSSGYEAQQNRNVILPLELRLVKRVRKVEAFVRVFNGNPPEDISDLCESIDLGIEGSFFEEDGKDSTVELQPYEAFFAKKGSVRYGMFLDSCSYSPEKMANFVRTYITYKKGIFATENRFFAGHFNPYDYKEQKIGQ